MKRLLGVAIFACGLGLGVWLAQKLLIERSREAVGRNPALLVFISGGSMYVGYKWAVGKEIGY